MDIALLTLVLITLLLVALLLLRPRGGDVAVLETKLADQHAQTHEKIDSENRRLREELERVRAALDASLRLAAGEQAALLAGARQAQDERLDRVAQATAELRQTLTQMAERMEKRQAEGALELTTRVNAQIDALKSSVNLAVAGLQEKVTAQLQERLERLDRSMTEFRESSTVGMEAQRKQLADTATALRTDLAKQFAQITESQAQSLAAMGDRVGARLTEMQKSNEEKLEKIRGTVDEKLQTTLEKRLGESFRTVSQQLENVQKGLGEMQALATGVGDLKRVLTNVKSRGIFGEVQLGALLEQVMPTSQFAANVAVKPGSQERVEFAICLPGGGENAKPLYLPIDAKFPTEDYERLQQAYDAGDKTLVEEARLALRKSFLREAKTIRDKYIDPPNTTDFAMMYLPTEGLYAEAIRGEGLMDQLQRECRVILVGPSTLYAILNSLQMGFRTLAIQKRSSEVWAILSSVKTEFGKFGDSLSAVGKKLQEATNKISDAERQSRKVAKTLHNVGELQADETPLLAGFLPVEEDADS